MLKFNTVPPGVVYAFALPTTAAKVIIANFIFERRECGGEELQGARREEKAESEV